MFIPQEISGGIKVRLQKLLQAAIKMDDADKGTLQFFNKKLNGLEIVTSEGFGDDFLAHFKLVTAFDSSCCGRALGVGSPIMINDVTTDASFKPNLKIAEAAGFRAVKSVPLFYTDGQRLGVLSTHYKNPKFTWIPKKAINY